MQLQQLKAGWEEVWQKIDYGEYGGHSDTVTHGGFYQLEIVRDAVMDARFHGDLSN